MSQHDTLPRFSRDMDGSMEPDENGSWVRFEDAVAALSASQPAQAAPSDAAEHWHRLYLEKCQQYNDRVAQLGGEIEGLEAQAAQPVQVVQGVPEFVSLSARIKELITERGTLRAVSRSFGIDVGYLSRLEHGNKVSPSPEVLAKLGVRDAGTLYERLTASPTPPAQAAQGEPVAWPKLDKPATVGAGTFGVGVSARLVVEAAQRRYRLHQEQSRLTPEQAREQEINRRKAWDLLNGPAQPGQADLDGWRLVPVDPPLEMMEAMPSLPAVGAPGDMFLKNKGWSLKAIQNRHRWMGALNASPTPPAQQAAQGAGEVVAEFDELPDEAIDDACTAGAIYRVDFMRAYNALRAAAAGADVEPEHVTLLNEKVRELEARDAFEAQNKCSHGFKRSARGTYVNPPVARDWKWFQLGIQYATKDTA